MRITRRSILAWGIYLVSMLGAIAAFILIISLSPKASMDFASGHAGPVRSVAWSPDGSLIASGDDSGTIRFWDVDTHTLLYSTQDHDGTVNALAFSVDSTALASGGMDGTVRLWDARSGTPGAVLEGPASIQYVAWDADGTRLASVAYDHSATIWSTTTHKPLSTIVNFDGSPEVALGIDDAANYDMVFAGEPSGEPCTSYRQALDNQAAQQRILQGYGHAVNAAVWSPNLANLVAASTLGEVVLFNASGAIIGRLACTHATSLAWAPDSEQVAVGAADGHIVIWDAIFKPLVSPGVYLALSLIAFFGIGLSGFVIGRRVMNVPAARPAYYGARFV